MGWLFSEGWTKQDVIKECVKDDPKIATLDYSVRGKVVWAICANKEKLAAGDPDAKFIACHLLTGSSREGWGYKSITESMGPNAVNCPLKYLKAVPVAQGPYGADWREKVRAHHADGKARRKMVSELKPCDQIQFRRGCTPSACTFVARRGRTLTGRADDGLVYGFQSKLIKSVTPA